MAYFRKRLGKWQCVIRIKGCPTTSKTFVVKKDAQIWAKNIELRYFREEIDILKLDNDLKEKFVKEKNLHDTYVEKKKQLEKILNKSSLTSNTIKKIKSDIIHLNNLLDEILTQKKYGFYIMEVQVF